MVLLKKSERKMIKISAEKNIYDMRKNPISFKKNKMNLSSGHSEM